MTHNLTHKTLRKAMILFIVFISFSSQAKKSAELNINIIDCREENKFAYLSELQILKNGNEFKTLNPQHQSQQVLKNLEFGTYTLVYKSLFNKEERLNVQITESKTYSTKVCINYMDYSKETYEPIIDRLQNKESYSIIISSQGCFHSSQDTIIIKRNNNAYTINWGTNFKTLSTTDLENIRQFEFELNYMTYRGCTTTDTYVIDYGGTSKQISDGSCRWNGDYYFKLRLFGDDE